MNKFDEIIKDKELMESSEGWKTVWTNVFGLESILIAVKSPETEEETVSPFFFLGQMNEKETTIFAFTDSEHADLFSKHIDETTGIDFKYEFKIVTVLDFVNMCQQLSVEGPDYVAFNHASEYGFHTEIKAIVPMFNLYIRGEQLQEQKVAENTEIQVAVPEDINAMKDAIESVKKNFTTVLNSVSPVLVRIENNINLTLVLEFKGGLPNDLKKTVMKNLHNELSEFPVFHQQVYFTEEQSIIPPNAKVFITVNI